jgi:ABC-type dipeptide/oligopeptide/nickel transport system permease component
MRIMRYIGKRMIFIGPQLLGIILVSFFLVKLIPGDPAVMMLGPMASESTLEELRADMGLNLSVPQQFLIYIENLVLHGDLGRSWQTTRPVTEDLFLRMPATLELITLGLILGLLIGVPLGVGAAYLKRGILAKFSDYYGLLAGALPDFWLALVLIFFFYTILGWVPPPLGRLDFFTIPPPTITGALLIDSLLDGNWQALSSAAGHLILPVLTLGLISGGPILKMTQSTMDRMLESDYSRYEEMCGLPKAIIIRHALRNSLPSVVTIVSVLYGFLIGGAVLVEIVFSWGGAGQYAVQGVLNADINPVLGFVFFSAVLSLIIYLIVDLIYFAIDPRVRG